MKSFKTLLPVIIFALLFIIGCSQPGKSPLLPSEISGLDEMDKNPVQVSDWDSNGNPAGGMGTLGLYSLTIDPDKVNAELISLRSASIIDTLEIIDITNFMQIFPCTSCVVINSVGINTDEQLVVNIGIKHPFAAGNPANPITGKNRADLHVFNVEGIVISNLMGNTFGGLSQITPGFNLVNAHGYTDYLDSSIDNIYLTFASIHPYITHFTDYTQGNFAATNPMGFASVVDPKPSGYCVMPMGSTYSNKDYIFDINGPMNFIFAIGCTYAVTTNTFEDRFTPEYRCPQHNKKAASKVNVSITNNDLRDGDTGSTAQINIDVVDLNHGVAVGTALNQMFADSSVSQIKVDIPAVMTTMLTIAGNSSISGTGHNPSDPLVYQGTITNTKGAAQGTYPGLVKVLDSYAPGQNTHPFIGENDGGKRMPIGTSPLMGLFEIEEFATYQVFTVDVSQSMIPPTGILVLDPSVIVNPPGTVDLDATGSTDADGSITTYEFDFDWDGIEANFNADATNATGLATTTTYNTPGSYTIGLKVTDNDLLVDYQSVDLKVNSTPTADLVKDPDVATLEQADLISLDASGSSDLDGTIVNYEFDCDWDGIPANFNVDYSTASGSYLYRLLDTGTFTIGVRVTDDDGGIDYDSVDIEVTPRTVIFVNWENVLGPWDGSFNNPYQFIQDGVDAVATDNTTVWVMPGVYVEDQGGGPSSGDAEITISGLTGLTLYGEGRPIISLHEYTDTQDICGIEATSCPDLTIDGFMFQPSNNYYCAIQLQASNNPVVQNCTIVPATPGFKRFLLLNGCNGSTVRDNYLYDVVLDVIGDEPSIVFYLTSADNALLTENIVSNLSYNFPAMTSGNYAYIIGTAGCDGVEISKNRIENSTLNINDDGSFEMSIVGAASSCSNVVLRNNLVSNISLTNKILDESQLRVFDLYISSNFQIYNNTIDEIDISDEMTYLYAMNFINITGASVYNNIVTNLSATDNLYGYFRSGGDALTVDYSDLWTLTGTGVVRFQDVTEGTNCINADPKYFIPTKDYHLLPVSPCKGTGSGGEDMGCYGGSDPLP